MEKYDDEKGVWRTIRGRRVFIREGESLGSAMSRSGKFKRSDIREAKANLRTEDYMNKIGKKSIFVNDKKYEKEVDKHFKKKAKKNEYTKFGYEHDDSKQAEKNRINENANIEGSGKTRVQRNWNRYSEEQRREVRHEILQKKLADYKAKKQSNNKVENTYAQDKKEGNVANRLKAIQDQERYDRLYDKYKEQGISDEKINNLLGERPKTGLESNNKVETEANGIKLLKVKDNEKGTYIEDLTNKYNDLAKQGKGNADTYKSLKKEIADLRKQNKNDWLPKTTEIKEQGTSNRKEVSDNIQAHILEYYSPDYTGENISPEKAFVRQMEAMKEPTMWKSGQRIAEGGSYLVYNGDMSDFLDSLKINPKGKKFSDDKAFQMYTSLIGRESEKLYNKIKKHEQDTINAYKKRKGK